MERWEIRAAPNANDSSRHLLLIKGGQADVAAVLKTFGALCGRPTPVDGGEFNLSFVLHKLTPEVRAKLDKWLDKRAPKPKKEASKPPRPPAPPPTPPPSLPSEPEPAEAAPPPAEPEPIQETAPAAPPTVPLSDVLRADSTFENLMVGAYNRFAHAAAMSVVSSPGAMYNPLFLHGAPGTGKTHFLHAIANSMSKGLGDASLFLTSGARLSRAVTLASERGSLAAVDKKVADSKAILIDDIHLLAVTERNKELFARIFKSFFDRNLQVVITSLYAPKSLGALEDALQFTFSKGWSVDLKIPSPSVQRDLVGSVNDRLGVELNGDEIAMLAEKMTLWGYSDLTSWAKRIAIMKKMRQDAQQPAALAEILRLIYDPIAITGEAAAPSTSGTTFSPPAARAGAQPLAVVVPDGQHGLGPYVAAQFHAHGAKHGFKRSYRHVLMASYDAKLQVGLPFHIADMCTNAGVSRVLLVGPSPESPLASRAAEFWHAVRHILACSGIAAAWVPFAHIGIAAHYLNAHLDFEA